MLKRWLKRWLGIKDVPEEVRNYLLTDPGMVMVYLIVSLRGEFMYNLARNVAEEPPTMQVLYSREKEEIRKRLLTIFADMKPEQVEEILNQFYK